MRAKLQALRAHLGETLFPAAAPGESRLNRWEVSLLVGGLLAIVVVLQLARLGWSASLNSLWAEDGPIYMQEALTQDFWHAIVSTYATYLVLVPRLIAEGASLAPLGDVPAAVSILSGLVVGLSGLVVWYAAARHIRNPWLRGTLVALTVLCPVAGLESLDSAAYVPWYMLFACFWLLLWRPLTLWSASLGGLFILLTGLSTPGLWFFSPLAALRMLATRDRRDAIVLGSYAIGAAVQIPVLALTSETAVEPLWTGDIWTVFLQRIVNGAPLGLRGGGEAWAHFGWPFLIALTVAVVVGLAYGFRRAARGARYLATIAILTSLLMFVVSLYQRAVGVQMLWPEAMFNGSGSRYAIVPALLLISAGLVLLESAQRERSRGPAWLPWPSMAAVALLAASIVVSFWARDLQTRGTPPWDAALDQAAKVCVVEDAESTAVPTSPTPFGIQVPCDQVLEASDPIARR
jgi:hypothetical protein